MAPLVVLKKKPFTFKEISTRYKLMQRLKFKDLSYFYMPYEKERAVLSINQTHQMNQMEQNDQIGHPDHADGANGADQPAHKTHEDHDMHQKRMLYETVLFNKTIGKLLGREIRLKKIIERTPVDISAVRDDKPFFFKESKGLTTEILLLLRIAIIVNILVIVIPAIYMRIRKNMITPLIIFILLGAGFMLIEISFFQKLTLYLGSPTISLAVLLGSLLTGMGAGSFFGGRFYSDNKLKKIVSFFIFIFVIALSFIQPLALNALLGSNIVVKSLVCLIFLVPLGFMLGIPFPTAISLVKEIGFQRAIPWMYGVNGTVSVLGSVGAIAISLTSGFSAAFS